MSTTAAGTTDAGPDDGTPLRSGRLVLVGLALLLAAATGWLVTWVATTFADQPRSTEDLTAQWVAAGPTPLGDTATVEVPAGRTLVAFLVGTQLLGQAGTTGGTCSATSQGRPVDLGWPALIQQSLTDVLVGDQQTVAVAGWTNDTGANATVDVTCDTADSTVEHFVAVPTRTGVVPSGPWFQPWLWIGLGAVGIVVLVAAVVRLARSAPPDRPA